jgi:hypothetical protein
MFGSTPITCLSCNGQDPKECEERGELKTCNAGEVCETEIRRRGSILSECFYISIDEKIFTL